MNLVAWESGIVIRNKANELFVYRNRDAYGCRISYPGAKWWFYSSIEGYEVTDFDEATAKLIMAL